MNWYQLHSDQESDVLLLSITAGSNVSEEQLESMLESGQTDVFTQNVSYILLFKLAEHCNIDFLLTFSFLHIRVVMLIVLSVHELHWNCKGKLVGASGISIQ